MIMQSMSDISEYIFDEMVFTGKGNGEGKWEKGGGPI